MSQAVCHLCFVRHGETAWNAEKRLQGQLDVPLSAVGEAQALALAERLSDERFDAIYSSDLARAWMTALAVAANRGLPVQPLPGVRERHYGIFQQLTYDEAARHHPDGYGRFKARDLEYHFEFGESLKGFADRVVAAMEELADRHAGQSVLVATHGGVLDIVYRHATGKALAAPRDFEIPNTGVNRVVRDATGWRLLAWGCVAHLDAGGLDEVAR